MSLPLTASTLGTTLYARSQSGDALTGEQAGELFSVIGELVRALRSVPRNADATAVGIWANHEREPALAALIDTLDPAGAAQRREAAEAERRRDADTAQQLLAALRR